MTEEELRAIEERAKSYAKLGVGRLVHAALLAGAADDLAACVAEIKRMRADRDHARAWAAYHHYEHDLPDSHWPDASREASDRWHGLHTAFVTRITREEEELSPAHRYYCRLCKEVHMIADALMQEVGRARAEAALPSGPCLADLTIRAATTSDPGLDHGKGTTR